MNNSVLLVVMVIVIAFFFFWSWRGNRKRQAAEAQKTSQLVKGVEIMTNSGIFGIVESVDLETNKVVLETSPGQYLTVHRQAISRIETPAEESVDDTSAESAETGASSIEAANAEAQAQAAKAADQKPEFGERIPPTKHDE